MTSCGRSPEQTRAAASTAVAGDRLLGDGDTGAGRVLVGHLGPPGFPGGVCRRGRPGASPAVAGNDGLNLPGSAPDRERLVDDVRDRLLVAGHEIGRAHV